MKQLLYLALTVLVVLSLAACSSSKSSDNGGSGGGGAPVADFTASPRSGDSPLAVEFIDLSTGNNVYAWSWDFGDGAISTDRNPTRTYTSPGTYDVTLTATDDTGTNSLTKPAYINVTDGNGLTISPSAYKPAGTSTTVQKALEYLDAAGGKWPTYKGEKTGQLVITAFCGLALMASGSTPISGPYKDSIKTAADHMAANITYDGTDMGIWNQSNWHITIGSVFLAEAYKGSGDASYKNALQAAANMVAAAQEPSCGYAHAPGLVCWLGYKECEILSNWAIMAMGTAEACGCSVDQTTLLAAVNYLPKCTLTSGAVIYSHSLIRDPSPCRTGSAIMALNLSGLPESSYGSLESIMISYLKSNLSQVPYGHASGSMGYLGGVLGCLCAGQETWDEYVVRFFQRILDHQNANGSFPAFDGDPGANQDSQVGIYYMTGINALILQLDLGNLCFLAGR
jgi:PKD repeat protein